MTTNTMEAAGTMTNTRKTTTEMNTKRATTTNTMGVAGTMPNTGMTNDLSWLVGIVSHILNA